MTTSAAVPFLWLPDLTGVGLEGGYVYFGDANTNPVTLANRISVFSDAACTIGLSQPLRTSGGFIVDGNGAPLNIYVAGTTDFSMAVQDAYGSALYSIASYPVRLIASSITFNTVEVATSVLPDAAGGAFIGSIALPFSNMVSRAAQIRNLSIYNETQPAVAADLVTFNQRAMNLLVGKQTNAGASPAATTVNIFNCGTITHPALGVYTVPFTVSPGTANVVALVQVQDNTTFYANASIDAGLTFVDVTIFNAAGAAADATFGIVVVGYPDIADPIS